MSTLQWLSVVALLSIEACQSTQPIGCHLTPEGLLNRQRISVQAVHLQPDTVELTSSDQLCWRPLGGGDSLFYLPTFTRQLGSYYVYDNKVAAWHFTDNTGNELVTTDTARVAFNTPILNRHLATQPQAILEFSIVNDRVTLAQGVRVGMPKRAFIKLLFKDLTPEETGCLLRQRAFVLADPVGEYINSTYSFAGDTLRRITLQSPSASTNARHQQ